MPPKHDRPRNEPTPRKRGGQPGNHNAYKHGFYSHLFRFRERRILEEQPLTDLSAEIELLHVTTARFLEAMQASDRMHDYESNITALRLVILSAQSVAALVRVQALTGAISRDLEDSLAQFESNADDADSPLETPNDPR